MQPAHSGGMKQIWQYLDSIFPQFMSGWLTSSLDKQVVLGSVIHHALTSPLSVLSNSSEPERKAAALKYIDQILLDFRKPAAHAKFSIGQTVVLISQQIEELPGSERVYFVYHESTNAILVGKQMMLVEAVVCLVNNALQSSKQTLVGLHLTATEQQVKIVVSDFGKGMNAWQQFVATKQNGQGIGLPFAKWVVETIFAGDLKLLSKPNLGTMVVISIPASSN